MTAAVLDAPTDILGAFLAAYDAERWTAPTAESEAEGGLIAAAIARQEARPVHRIDYDRMQRVGPQQKRALNKAIKTKDPEKIAAVCKAAVAEWDEIGCWPDHWSTWQRALDDVLPWHSHIDIRDL
jgi:hypothetical protein